ncbi:uncharacterized protein LOC131873684 isoform X1 [Cryptomeria japonica]|uniref:uncharacterized protein LOC131873684 isoform X1 n=1 Tax=Cryptomeria japonica TaxID=3369 RepID=UPI0027D9E8CA|nr:uncharacterized protein LOC131873684 isoform X1 [Cryptomeria japonica]
MTITVNINNKLIDTFLPQLLPGASVRLTKFTVKKKSQYERGDADYCIQLTAKTTIESIDKVCKKQKLTPDTTISQLIHSPNNYSIGTLGVLVASQNQEPNEFQLQVKDGELPSDTATLTVPKVHTNSYATLERLLTSARPPLLLLKNVVRGNTRGSSDIRSSLSTYIDELNDEYTKGFLQTLASSNLQVAGTLKTKNVYLPPYQPLCNLCHSIVSAAHMSANNTAHCTTCASTTTFAYQHYLQCTIETEDGTINCNLHTKLLQQNFPELTKITFENYKQNISATIYLMCKFEIRGTFTIAMNNSIIAIAQEASSVILCKPLFCIATI